MGCGGEDPPAASPPGEAAADASRALREAGTFRFDARYVRIRADAPDESEEYASSSGAVDLLEDRGRMLFRFSLPELAEVEPFFAEETELTWDSQTLAARLGGEVRTLGRAQARADGGLLGRLPDEPAGLLALLERAGPGTPLGTATIGRVGTSGYRFAVDEDAAGRAGVPAEVAPALENGVEGMELTLEAWLDAASVPRRLAYVLALEPVRGSDGRRVLPARTVRVTYDLSGFGEPVEVELPRGP